MLGQYSGKANGGNTHDVVYSIRVPAAAAQRTLVARWAQASDGKGNINTAAVAMHVQFARWGLPIVVQAITSA